MDDVPAYNRTYPRYYFRMCAGMVASGWGPLLLRNRFAVSPTRIPVALLITAYSVISSLLSLAQDAIFAKRIAASRLSHPPIFIIGHWRTGTTYLHELLMLDERFVAPTTLECFAPAHFLLSGPLLRYLSFFLPDRRPMDDISIGWDSPQEDEFALMNLGVGSPYETLLFPNNRPARNEFLTITKLPREHAEAWKSAFLTFLRSVNFHNERERSMAAGMRRIVLKSPPHTARLAILRQMFPAAQFIHLVRHPHDIFASTLWLWRTLYETQGFQRPRFGSLPSGAPSLEEHVLDTMDLLYRDFFAEAAHIPPQQLCTVRYENFVRNPVSEMETIYRHLELGAFDLLVPKLQAHLRKIDGYKRNAYRLSEEQKAEVCSRWHWYADRFGYGISSFGSERVAEEHGVQ
jgi:hypothetical protein